VPHVVHRRGGPQGVPRPGRDHAGHPQPAARLVADHLRHRPRPEVAAHRNGPRQGGGQRPLDPPHRRSLRAALEHRRRSGREQRRPGPGVEAAGRRQAPLPLERPHGLVGLGPVGAADLAPVLPGRPEQALDDPDAHPVVAAAQRPVAGPVGVAPAHRRGTTYRRRPAEVDEVAVDGQPHPAVRRTHVQRVLVHAVVGPPPRRAQVLAPADVAPPVRPREPHPVRGGVATAGPVLAHGRDAGAHAGVHAGDVPGPVQPLGPRRQEVQRRGAAAAVVRREPLEVVPQRPAAADAQPGRGASRPPRRALALLPGPGVAPARAGPGRDPGPVRRAARLRADPDRQQPPAHPGLVAHPAAGEVPLGARPQRAADVDAHAEERRADPPAVHRRARGCPAGVERVAGPAVRRRDRTTPPGPAEAAGTGGRAARLGGRRGRRRRGHQGEERGRRAAVRAGGAFPGRHGLRGQGRQADDEGHERDDGATQGGAQAGGIAHG